MSAQINLSLFPVKAESYGFLDMGQLLSLVEAVFIVKVFYLCSP